MNNSVRSMLAAALLAGAAAAPAHATGEGGTGAEEGAASAAVLRTNLDVGLLDKTVDVPLETTLNEVSTENGGGTERKTALTARLDGVDRGKPFSVLRAKVADAEAGREQGRTWGRVTLADAKVHLPGLPLLSVVELEKVTSRVECAAGKQPQAEANVLGTVRVLGERVELSAGGPTEVKVPGLGEVTLELSRADVSSNTAAAAALDLSVAVDPLELGVADVSGSVTLAEATCTAPTAPEENTEENTEENGEENTDGGAESAPEPETQTLPDEKQPAEPAQSELAATGGSSATPYVVGGGAMLLVVGGAAVFAARRRAAKTTADR